MWMEGHPHLVQFAQMGSIYMEHVMGIRNPRSAIVNIGAEEEKGQCAGEGDIPAVKGPCRASFIGSIGKPRGDSHGVADVIVCSSICGLCGSEALRGELAPL